MRGQRCVVLLGSLLSSGSTPLAAQSRRCCEPSTHSTSRAATASTSPGSGPTLNLDAPLQGHTCKFRDAIADQLFDEAAGQHVRASEYDRCLAVEALEPGQPLAVAELHRLAPATLAARERPLEPGSAARALRRARRRTRRALGHAAARHAGLSPADAGARRVRRPPRPIRRRSAGCRSTELVSSRADNVACRHAGGRRRGARGVRPRVRRRDRAANGRHLCDAAARLRARRDRGREGPCVRPARAPATSMSTRARTARPTRCR